MAFPTHQSELIARARSGEKIEPVRYEERMREFFGEVVGAEAEFMSPVRVVAVLTCKEDQSLKVLLFDIIDVDHGPVRIQAWNTPEWYWQYEGVVGESEKSEAHFRVRDEENGVDKLISFSANEEEVGILVEGVGVSWKIDMPENGDDQSDPAFQTRFFRLVDEASPVISLGGDC